jgi:D-alanyl-D-alanine carboxypeptidase
MAALHGQKGAFRRASLAVMVAACLSILSPALARAQIGSSRYSSIVIDAASGRVLSAMDADEPRYPASLTKLMTLYLTFEALRDRRIGMNQLVPVSSHAASMEPSKLGLVPGTQITVEQAILGLVTKSANDAAAALGEMLAGSEDRFGQMMTLRARSLGMAHTVFRNASGLPDPDQVTTARDMAILARHIIYDFPGYYHYFSTPSFVFHRRVIMNHDTVMKTYAGADGLKTGYTDAAGHNLVTSAVRGNVRLIGVVLGAGSNPERDRDMVAQLNDGFRQEGAPVMVARSAEPAGRSGALIARAEAATIDPPARGQPTLRLTAAHALPQPEVRGRLSRWGVQVGSFSTSAVARKAAAAAHAAFDAGAPHVERAMVHRKAIYRAQLVGLSQAQASGACAARAKAKKPCIVLRPEQGEVASR